MLNPIRYIIQAFIIEWQVHIQHVKMSFCYYADMSIPCWRWTQEEVKTANCLMCSSETRHIKNSWETPLKLKGAWQNSGALQSSYLPFIKINFQASLSLAIFLQPPTPSVFRPFSKSSDHNTFHVPIATSSVPLSSPTSLDKIHLVNLSFSFLNM